MVTVQAGRRDLTPGDSSIGAPALQKDTPAPLLRKPLPSTRPPAGSEDRYAYGLPPPARKDLTTIESTSGSKAASAYGLPPSPLKVSPSSLSVPGDSDTDSSESMPSSDHSKVDGKKAKASRKIRKTRASKSERGRTYSRVNHQFRWEDNKHIQVRKFPYKVGVPVPLIVKLFDTKGNECVFQNQAQDKLDWDNGIWVTRKNHWYNEIIAQRLDCDEKKPFPARKPVQHWTVVEKESLIQGAVDKILKNKRDLTTEDVSLFICS